MTIQKAIESGKPFRRKCWGRRFSKDWYVHPPSKIGGRASHLYSIVENWNFISPGNAFIRDILATDWEIKD